MPRERSKTSEVDRVGSIASQVELWSKSSTRGVLCEAGLSEEEKRKKEKKVKKRPPPWKTPL